MATTLSLTTSATNLRRLAMIRLILITGLLGALIYTKVATASDLFHPAYLTILALLALVNLLTYWRLSLNWPVTDGEFFAQLLFDIAGLTVVLYVSGGASNPFISYYLVPITISAALLPWRYTWTVSGLSLAAYTLMLFYYRPLPTLHPQPGLHAHDGPVINLHVLGMWLTFALSTVLITYFVVKMADALRRQQQQQAVAREDRLRDEQILAVATLAAGTAHELGTPLSTMMVLLDEIEAGHRNDTALTEDLHLLKAQVDSCKRILNGLASTADVRSHQEKHPVDLGEYIETLVDHWRVIRPQATIHTDIAASARGRQLWVEPTLEQAIANLLNNAADASPEPISLSLTVAGDRALIAIRDRGPGVPLAVAEHLGKPFFSSQGKGLGLGLFLSHATIDRYGGSIALHNHPEGGTVAELRLPLDDSGQGGPGYA